MKQKHKYIEDILICIRIKENTMKNFKNYTPEKYSESKFQQVEEGIYCTKDPYGISSKDIYVTSLSFEMEPEL